MTFIQKLRNRLLAIAINDHAEHPQYKGYFDSWILAVSVRTVKYQGGSRLVNGRYVLASPDLKNWFDPDNGHECGVNAGCLKRLV